jgi:hypothetical protein
MVQSVVITADRPLLKAYLTVFGAKLAMALYREHIGLALPLTGGVQTTFFLNAGLVQRTADTILRIIPLFGTLKQRRFRVPDQFAYRYNTDGKSVFAALIRFHKGLHLLVWVTSKPDFYRFRENPLFTEPYIKPGGIREIMPTDILPPAPAVARPARLINI